MVECLVWLGVVVCCWLKVRDEVGVLYVRMQCAKTGEQRRKEEKGGERRTSEVKGHRKGHRSPSQVIRVISAYPHP